MLSYHVSCLSQSDLSHKAFPNDQYGSGTYIREWFSWRKHTLEMLKPPLVGSLIGFHHHTYVESCVFTWHKLSADARLGLILGPISTPLITFSYMTSSQ